RSGFKPGQEVIVLRGREQVAVAVVTDVDPDSATVRVTRLIKGIQPGDSVRVVFQVPNVAGGNPSNSSGDVRMKPRPKGKGGSANFASLLVVLGIAVVLFGQGRGSSTGLVNNANA